MIRIQGIWALATVSITEHGFSADHKKAIRQELGAGRLFCLHDTALGLSKIQIFPSQLAGSEGDARVLRVNRGKVPTSSYHF